MAKSASKSTSPAKKNGKPVAKKLVKIATRVPVKAAKTTPLKPAKPLPGKAVKKIVQPVVAPRLPAKMNGKVKPVERVKTKTELKPEPEYVMTIASPVATNLKPRKNQAGFGSRDLENFRDQLLEKRREIVGDMSSMEREALRSGGGSNLSTLPIHMADMGTDNYEQEFTLGLVEKDRNLLREINNALAKIQNGAFGICEGTGKPISKARLEVQPWARFSIDYARKIEKGGMGVR